LSIVHYFKQNEDTQQINLFPSPTERGFVLPNQHNTVGVSAPFQLKADCLQYVFCTKDQMMDRDQTQQYLMQ